jgi:hypothetical protein
MSHAQGHLRPTVAAHKVKLVVKGKQGRTAGQVPLTPPKVTCNQGHKAAQVPFTRPKQQHAEKVAPCAFLQAKHSAWRAIIRMP